MQLLVNHMGYNAKGSKRAVFQGKAGMTADTFRLLGPEGDAVYEGHAVACGPVANWKTGEYWALDFSACEAPGTYTLLLDTSEGAQRSLSFEITGRVQDMRLINAVSYYFKAQRSTGEWSAADSDLPFRGEREGRVDGHGGWLDATGDYGIHMSHLSHSSVCNPQQVAFSAYVFFKAEEALACDRQYALIRRRLLDEGTFGADFIMRMRAPSGSFFRSINRRESFGVVTNTREVGFEYHGSSAQFSKTAATAEQETVTDENYETSLRSGGGTCIAALAAAARHPYPGTAYHTDEYLAAAKSAFAYLWRNNERYCNDGQWNLLDEYCALLAACELYQTAGDIDYLVKAEELAKRMLARMEETDDGFAWFTSRPGEPFCHAADEGLPVVALLLLADLAPEGGEGYLQAAEKAMRHVLAITEKVANPFGYARYAHRTPEGGRAEKFFYYHTSPAAPWWQGDNARIASLAAAAWMLALRTRDATLAQRLSVFAQNQLNWILGLNPFDACMMEGYGRNNIEYFFNGRFDFVNCPGGICNGITSRPDDEEGIFFLNRPMEGLADNWRWAEQWIPHGSWFLLAMGLKQQCKARL